MIDVKSFGAIGDGVADDTAAIQTALNQAITSGETLVFPEGIYNTTTPITGKLISRNLFYPNRALRIQGAGSANCVINWLGGKDDTALTLTGNMPIDDRFMIEGIRIIRPDPGPTLQGHNGAGLRLQNFLDAEVRDCYFFRHAFGLHLIGCLLVTLDRSAMYYNDIGLQMEQGIYTSSPNVISARGCVFSANYSRGAEIVGGTQQSFIDCTFESTGEDANVNSIAAEIVNDGASGAVGAVFERCYFEGNRGRGVYWYSDNDLPQTLVVQDCAFNRLPGYEGPSLVLDFSSRAANTPPALVRLHGSTFWGYGSDTPDPTKPHLSLNVNAGFDGLTIGGLSQTLRQIDFGTIPSTVTIV